MKFIHFSMGSFTQNDQSARADIAAMVGKGDLLKRELGYFAIASFEKPIKRKLIFWAGYAMGQR
jgi:hypothetical protein